MCEECFTCDYVGINIPYLNSIQKKYGTNNFNELMEAVREERGRELSKLCDSILRDSK